MYVDLHQATLRCDLRLFKSLIEHLCNWRHAGAVIIELLQILMTFTVLHSLQVV